MNYEAPLTSLVWITSFVSIDDLRDFLLIVPSLEATRPCGGSLRRLFPAARWPER